MKIYLLFFLFLFSSAASGGSTSPHIHHDNLPQKMQSFLDKHFGKYEIEKLKYDGKKGDCKVKYKNGIKVEFDSNGDWEEIESDYVPLPKSIIDILPAPAIRLIANKYPRKPIEKIKRKSYGYKVELGGSIDIKFDQQGNIIKIDD